jgi:hypothetical protein
VFAATYRANLADLAGSGLPAGCAPKDCSVTSSASGTLLSGCPEHPHGLGDSNCYWGFDRAGLSAIQVTAVTQKSWWMVALRAHRQSCRWQDCAPRDGLLAGVDVEGGRFFLLQPDQKDCTFCDLNTLASGRSDAVQRSGENTVELGVDGPYVYMRVNGVEVARLLDPQVRRGLGAGSARASASRAARS